MAPKPRRWTETSPPRETVPAKLADIGFAFMIVSTPPFPSDATSRQCGTAVRVRQRQRLLVTVYTPTPVFRKKSLDLLDCKGVEFFGDDKEFATI
jgi:hypothetical protein